MSDFERYARTAFKYIRRFLPRIIKFASRQFKQRKGKAGHAKPDASKPHAAGPTNHGLPAKHGQQPAQHAAAAASAEHVEIGELKRYGESCDTYCYVNVELNRHLFVMWLSKRCCRVQHSSTACLHVQYRGRSVLTRKILSLVLIHLLSHACKTTT
jgi:hypothetical protein